MSPDHRLDDKPDSRTERRPAAPAVPRVDTPEQFEAQLNRFLVRSRRQGDPLALLWIEVDLLSPEVAPGTGNPRDDLAQAICARLAHRVRRTDQVFQVGPARFAVLLDTDKPGAQLVECRLVEQLWGPYGVDEWLMYVRLSTGLATSPDARQHGCSLLRYALDDLKLRRQTPLAPPPATRARIVQP